MEELIILLTTFLVVRLPLMIAGGLLRFDL